MLSAGSNPFLHESCTGGSGWLSRYIDSLRAAQSGDRIPVGARLFAPVQNVSVAQPASYTVGTRSFPGVNRQRRAVDHPSPTSAKVEERV
jgi:hypothetical protein